MSTTTDIATRRNGLDRQQSSAVAIRAGQAEFDDKQKAALVAMGVSDKVTRAELAVFFHQCQRLRLDPFTKQIYLIHRKTFEDGKWVLKPTTQIGIDGFRVTRDRIADEKNLLVEYEDTLWYDADGQAYEVWLWDHTPAACRFVVKVGGRRFPSVLRFNEYAQRNKDGQLVARWRDGFAHQIEKCAEADALRRAFPNDLSGVILEDAAPLDDPDAPPQRQRVTADQARQRAQRVKSEVVQQETPPPWEAPWPGDAQTAPPAEPASTHAAAPPAAGEPQGDAGGAHHYRDGDPRNVVLAELERLGVHGEAIGDTLTQLARKPLASVERLNHKQATWFAERLPALAGRDDLEALLATGEVRDE